MAVSGPLGLPSATALLFSSSSRGAQRGVEPRRERTALSNRGSVPAGCPARSGIDYRFDEMGWYLTYKRCSECSASPARAVVLAGAAPVA
jgi:hypothetical protein